MSDGRRLTAPGVYFLLKKGKVIYIGQTRSLSSRLTSYHRCAGKYDSVRFMECDLSKMKEYEARWIARFRPKYNKNLNPDRPKKPDYFSVSLRIDAKLADVVRESAIKSKRTFNKEVEYTLAQKFLPNQALV